MLNLGLTKTQRDFWAKSRRLFEKVNGTFDKTQGGFFEKSRGLGVKGHGSPIQGDALQGRFQSLKEPT